MINRYALSAFLVAVLSSGAVAPVRADDTPNAARAHYARGLMLYDLQHYRAAVKEFEAAYEAKADPAFLYNIGQAYRLSGDWARAIGAYRNFLRRMPSAVNRTEVEQRMTELQEAMAVDLRKKEDDKNPDTVVENPPAERSPAENRSAEKAAGTALLSAGAAALAVAVGLGVNADAIASDVAKWPPGTPFDPAVEQAFLTSRAGSIALVALGSASAVAGAVVLGLGFRADKQARLTVSPVIGPNEAGASLSLRF